MEYYVDLKKDTPKFVLISGIARILLGKRGSGLTFQATKYAVDNNLTMVVGYSDRGIKNICKEFNFKIPNIIILDRLQDGVKGKDIGKYIVDDTTVSIDRLLSLGFNREDLLFMTMGYEDFGAYNNEYEFDGINTNIQFVEKGETK